MIYVSVYNLNEHHYHSYFTDDETETERLNNLPKIRQLENSEARASVFRVYMLTPKLYWWLKAIELNCFLVNLIIVLCSISENFLLFFFFQPPSRLQFPPYKGCIELDDLNENVLSLYNFKKTFNLNTTEVEPCRR